MGVFCRLRVVRDPHGDDGENTDAHVNVIGLSVSCREVREFSRRISGGGFAEIGGCRCSL